MRAARPVARHRPPPTRPRIVIGRAPIAATVTDSAMVVPAGMLVFGQVKAEVDLGGGLFIVGPYMSPGFVLTSPPDVPADDAVPDSAAPYAEDGP